MSDELQQHGWDTTRALAESGGSGAVLRELVTNVGAIANGDKDVFELIQKYGTKYYHFPSEERMAKGIPSYTSTESIVSGASMIGVDDTNFNSLTGNTSLQAVLDEIDTFLTGGGSAPYLLQDGTTPLSGNWDVGSAYAINNASSLSIYANGLSGSTIQPTKGFDSITDDTNSNYIGGLGIDNTFGNISNGSFSSATDWTFNGGWSFDTGHALYTDNGADGTLAQGISELDVTMIKGMLYKLTYTVTNGGTDSIAVFTLNTTTVLGAVALTIPSTDGTHTVYFKSNGSTFEINAEGGSGAGTIQFDTISVNVLDNAPITTIANLTAFNGLNVDSRGVSGGGGLSVINSDETEFSMRRYDKTFSSTATLGTHRIGGTETQGESQTEAYKMQVNIPSGGSWSSGDTGVEVVHYSNRQSESSEDEYLRITEDHDIQWWKGDSQNGVSSWSGRYVYRPVMGIIETTGSAVTVKTIPIGGNEHHLIEVSGFGHIENGNQDEDFGQVLNLNVYRHAGNAVISNTTTIKAYNNGTALIQAVVSGSDILIQVVGVATEDIVYLVNVSYQDLSLK